MGSRRSFVWEDLGPTRLWYLIGLIASDGSLSKDGRHVDITSKYKDYLTLIKSELKINSAIGKKHNGTSGCSYRIQIGSKSFHEYLRKLGLFSNKSKALGRLNVPNPIFGDFLRGVIDGDGCIRKWKHPHTDKAQWYLKITSGSRIFLEWINETLLVLFKIQGSVLFERNDHGQAYILKFSKRSHVKKILGICYEHAGLALTKKLDLALELLEN